MELRSYNVERIYSQVVICEIQGRIGINKKELAKYSSDIEDMLHQIRTNGGYQYLMYCNNRVDGEIWTPYLQIVIMLIRMGEKLGIVSYKGDLEKDTLIQIKEKQQ